eukprot:4667471-Amphidinium_carterae.2
MKYRKTRGEPENLEKMRNLNPQMKNQNPQMRNQRRLPAPASVSSLVREATSEAAFPSQKPTGEQTSQESPQESVTGNVQLINEYFL